MNRPMLPKLFLFIALSTMSIAVLNAATKRPIHPTTLGTGGPMLIAIVGDHYRADEEDEFNYDVDNFLKRGLLIDDYYKDRHDDWRFVSYFEPTDATKESRYGFKIGLGEGNCAVLDNQDPDPTKTTTQLLAAAAGTDTPRHTIILGNHPYNFGCSKDNWTYIAVDAVGTDVLPHEFGHRIAFLWDEWFAASTANVLAASTQGSTPYYPPTWTDQDTRNCWPVGTGAPTPPKWESHVPAFSTPFANKPGCDQSPAGVIHPYDHCRMGTAHTRKFCEVCAAEMDKSFSELVQEAINSAGNVNSDASIQDSLSLRASHAPTNDRFQIVNAAFVTNQPVSQPVSPAVAARPILRIVMRYNRATKAVTIRQMLDGNGQYVPSYRRVGQYLYEIKDAAGLVEVGVIPDQDFEAHGSRGGAPHATAKMDDVELVLMIPGRTVASLSTRPLQVQFYKIPAGIKERSITKTTFPKLNPDSWEKWGDLLSVTTSK